MKNSFGRNFMEKNNTQFTTKEYKKLLRKLKFILWVNKTFTRDNVMAAVCGISLGLSVALSMISFIHANLLGGFGFQLASLWAIGSWTAFLVSDKSKKEMSDFENVFEFIAKTSDSVLNDLDKKNKI